MNSASVKALASTSYSAFISAPVRLDATPEGTQVEPERASTSVSAAPDRFVSVKPSRVEDPPPPVTPEGTQVVPERARTSVSVAPVVSTFERSSTPEDDVRAIDSFVTSASRNALVFAFASYNVFISALV